MARTCVIQCNLKTSRLERTAFQLKRAGCSVQAEYAHTPYKDSTGNDLVNSCVDSDNNGECDYCKGTVEKKHVHELSEYIHTDSWKFCKIRFRWNN